eukprot:3870937-Pyramimonas_sp.AAC.1
MVAHAVQCDSPHHHRAAELTPPPARPRRAQVSSHPHLMKVRSSNTGSLISIDRMGELLRLAKDRLIAIVCFQSAFMS